jgi:hypothetical protein
MESDAVGENSPPIQEVKGSHISLKQITLEDFE